MYWKTAEVTTNSLSGFINSNDICVIRAKTGTELGFNSILKTQLEQQFKDKVTTGWINIAKVNYKAGIIQQFLHRWMPNIGMPISIGILPGYYLFYKGTLTAYHPGTMHPGEFDPNVQGFAALAGAIAGLLVGIVANDALAGIETFVSAMEGPQALKVFQFFKEILEGQNKFNFHFRQQTVYDEELEKAYNILGVSPQATEVEISKAYRELMKKFHPDKHTSRTDENNKIAAEINNAYELIKKSRAQKKTYNAYK